MMVFNYTIAIYAECEYCKFSTKKWNMWIQFDWRFRMILRLYTEIGQAVSQLLGVNLIWFLLLFAIFKFWYTNVEWRYVYSISLYSFCCCFGWIVSLYSIIEETFLVSFVFFFFFSFSFFVSFLFPFSNSCYAKGSFSSMFDLKV